jgi:hypothetical protein
MEISSGRDVLFDEPLLPARLHLRRESLPSSLYDPTLEQLVSKCECFDIVSGELGGCVDLGSVLGDGAVVELAEEAGGALSRPPTPRAAGG